jgi:hypothetical protein
MFKTLAFSQKMGFCAYLLILRLALLGLAGAPG